MCLSPISLWADFETFTNEVGQILEVELLELNKAGNQVSVRLRSGNTVYAELSFFSVSDCQRIRKWWKGGQADIARLQPDSRIEISVR